MRGVTAKKEGWRTLYKKELTDVLRNQADVSEKYGIMFRVGPNNVLWWAASSSMTLEYILACYIGVKKSIWYRHGGNLWIENSDGNAKVRF